MYRNIQPITDRYQLNMIFILYLEQYHNDIIMKINVEYKSFTLVHLPQQKVAA